MTSGDVAQFSAWDVEGLRAAVGRLDTVLDRLPALRLRLDHVVRTVWSGEGWSGPGALAASGALSRLSAAAAGGVTELDDSLRQLQRAVGEAAEARAAAEEVLLLGQTVDASLFGPLSPERYEAAGVAQGRLEALGERARQHAAAAAAAAQRAGEEVPELDTVAQLAPGSWGGRLDGAPDRPPVDPPRMPTGRIPEDTAAWWSVMSPAQQLAAIARDPAAVGALAGVPAWARDRANRRVLAGAMATAEGAPRDTATAIAREIAGREAAGEQVQLLELDVEDGLVALGLGDLDTAASVGLVVPGVGNDVASDLDAVADDARAVADAAEAAAPGLAVATVAWMGYQTPPGVGKAAMPGARYAQAGGRALNASLNGLAAARVPDSARVTVLAHSYGSVVTDRAVGEPGAFAADAVVVLGSPGMSRNADELEVAEVYEASSPSDPVAQSQYFGNATWDEDFGAERLPTEWDTGHSEYYDRDRPTRAAIGEVVAGVR